MMRGKVAIVGSLALLAWGCGRPQEASWIKEAWNPANDPSNMNPSYNRVLSSLPLTGKVKTVGWSDTYWPSFKGGIADRWRTADDPFKYVPPSQGAVAAMSLADLSRLSPAEKYDIYSGRYDYPTVQSERTRTSSKDPSWEGICHGWAPAAINFPEPHGVLLIGQGGVKVPFGASDVKALLTYYQGMLNTKAPRVIGARCNWDLNADPSHANDPECRDTNAGSLHIALANELGLNGQAFVVDVVRATQVWNQPLTGFKSTVVKTQPPSPGAAMGTVSEAVIHTELDYVEETGASWNPENGTSAHADGVKTYDYRVELNSGGEVIGGEWLEDDRPDFVWMQDRPDFSGYYGAVADIAAQAVTDPVFSDPTM